MPERVCVVVLNWNTPAETTACLESLRRAVRGLDAVVVCCDNASTDGSLAALEAWAANAVDRVDPGGGGASDANFFLVRTSENLGYAGGNNAAIRFAQQRGAFDWFWILNSDTTVDEGALRALLECGARHPRAGVIGSTVVRAEDPERVECAGGFRYRPALTTTRAVRGGERVEAAVADAREPRLDCVSGAASFVRAAAWAEVGPLCEDFELYCEELDWAARARRQGWALAWCRASRVAHVGGASTGGRSRTNPRGSARSAYHETLSTLRFTAKHHRWLVPVALVSRLVLKLAAAVVFWRPETVGPLLRGCGDFLRTPRRRQGHHDSTPVLSGVLEPC